MATARLLPLAFLVVDFFTLTQVLTAGAAGKLSDDSFMPIVDPNSPPVAVGAALLAPGPGNILSSRLVLAAGEKSSESTALGPGDSKSAPSALKTPKNEKSNAASPAPKAPAAGKSAAAAGAPESRAPAKPAGPSEKPQEVPDEKSPSILQMLAGHETELLVAVAIALAFFVIGWICGGNYYLRRDRRRRTKLRF